MIDQGTVDKIMDSAQIVDVVSQFVTLKRRGINYVGLCPFHTDKSPSFYVSPSKNICKCFACGEGGTAVHFIMKHEQLSYYEALKFLAKKYGIEIQERELSDEQKKAYNERESLFILNDYARDYFTKTLHEHIEGKSVGLSYFRERGFRDDIIQKFQLGYSLEQRDAFSQEALKNGYKKEFLVKTGLTIEGDNNYIADRFRGRVMFPVHTLSGKVVAFGGRILKKAENTGKYVNSPESEIYHKGNELYGIYFAKQAVTKADCCYLVEGYTDVIAMHQAGIENVVASSGTALTNGQIRLIHRFTDNVTVLYDGDAAGIKAALRGIDLLLEDGLNIKVVLLPDGEDPDSFSRKQNAASLTAYLKENEVDFIRFKTQLLLADAGDDPIKRAALITDIVNSISIIPDNIIRTVYIKDCSALLGVDEQVLVHEVNKKIRGTREKLTTQPLAITPPPEDLFIPDDAYVSSSNTSSARKVLPTDKKELAILSYIVRYGMNNVIEPEEDDKNAVTSDEEDESITVIDYVRYDLERDGLWFVNDLYKTLLDEATEHAANKSFNPSRYFLAHQNQQVSKLAAELISDKYELSKYHIKQFGENAKKEDTPLADEKNLERLVPRALTELKAVYVEEQIRAVLYEMAEMQKKGNTDSITDLLMKMKQLKVIKDTLAKELGDRIVLKF